MQADAFLPPVDAACSQGLLLGAALQRELGSDYHQHVHFIGHSLGTIVNAYACDYVHGSFPSNRQNMNPSARWDASRTRPHTTLLDEAELTSILGSSVIPDAAVAWLVAQSKGGILSGPAAILAAGNSVAANWRNPIPREARWVDNYISAVGLKHDAAVNVTLVSPVVSLQTQTLGTWWQSAEAAHAYAHLWYRNSIPASRTPAPIGFNSSQESGAAFPPTGSGTALGTQWWENIDTSDPFDLTRTRPKLGLVLDVAFTGSAPFGFALAALPAAAAGTGASAYGLGIEWVGNIGGTVIYKTGEVTTQTLEKVGLWWDAAKDTVADVKNSLNPDAPINGSLAAPVFGIQLQTTLAARPNSGRNLALAATGTLGQPAAAWVMVNVPADAGLMAFDFTVTGDPQEDSIACAINDQNVFTLPAKFAPDGQTVSTDMIDVSAYAGQNAELFFGLVGGTSTDCQVAVDGIRFITVPPPRLAVTAAAGNTVLQWPAAATGWILETTDALAAGNWQTVPTDSGVTVSDGILTLEQPMTDKRRFYRLRKSP